MSEGRTTPEWSRERPRNQPLREVAGPVPEPPPPASPGPMSIQPSHEPPATNWAPKPKMAAAAVTVPFSGLVLWIAGELSLNMPPHVAGEVAVLIALVVAYLVPDR